MTNLVPADVDISIIDCKDILLFAVSFAPVRPPSLSLSLSLACPSTLSVDVYANQSDDDASVEVLYQICLSISFELISILSAIGLFISNSLLSSLPLRVGNQRAEIMLEVAPQTVR